MQKNILWAGLAHHSIENCMVSITEKGATVKSSLVGMYDNVLYKVDYQILTNELWETTFFEIKSQLYNKINLISFQGDSKGNWFSSGKYMEEFNGCIDIDLSMTPLTNTLPINRLKPFTQKNFQIKVLYIDILGQQTNRVLQNYTKISDREYKYENVPNDFESIIVVDHLGLVMEYPKLFKRLHSTERNYR